MLKSVTDILKGVGTNILPIVNNQIANSLGLDEKCYAQLTNKLFDRFKSVPGEYFPHSYFNQFMTIPPTSNAAYGLGGKGPKELAPAFIGDRQELIENKEKIEQNPVPKALTRKPRRKRMNYKVAI